MAESEAACTCRKSASGTTATRRSRRKGRRAEVHALNQPSAPIGRAQEAMNSVAKGSLRPGIALSADVVWLAEKEVSLAGGSYGDHGTRRGAAHYSVPLG